MAGLAEKIKRDYAAAERAERSAAMAGAEMGPGQADRVAANHEAIVLLAERLDELVAALKRATSGARSTNIRI